MRSQKQSRKQLLQYVAVLFLSVTAAWIWYRRSVPYVRPATPIARIPQPAPKNQPESNSKTWILNPDPEQARNPELLLEAIKVGNLQFLFKAIDSNQMVDNDFGLRVFDLVCEHGTVEAMQLILTKSIYLPPAHQNRINLAIDKLIDRSRFDCFSLIGQSQNLNYQTVGQNYFVREFSRTPFDSARLNRLLSVINTDLVQILNPLVAACKDSQDKRIEWIIEVLKNQPRRRPGQEQTELRVNPSNVDIVMRLLPYLPAPQSKLTTYLHLLNSSHFESVCEIFKNQMVPEAMMPYVLGQNSKSLQVLFKANSSFRAQLKSKWNSDLRNGVIATEFKRKYEPIVGLILEQSLTEDRWTTFDAGQSSLPEWDWLWQHGFRPNATTKLACKIVLAIRFNDMELLRDGLSNDTPELRQLLSGSVLLRKVDSLSRGNDTFFFVPVTEAASTGNLQALALILDRIGNDLKQWKHSSPLLSAAKAGKMDVFKYLLRYPAFANIEFLDEFSKWSLETSTEVEQYIDEIQMLRGLSTEIHQSIGIGAAKRGNLRQMVASLEHVPFRKTYSGNAQTMTKESLLAMEIGMRLEPSLFVKAAIPHPKCLARLQFEGFNIGHMDVAEIMKQENSESLKIALQDLETRNRCRFLPHVIVSEGMSKQIVDLFYSLVDEVSP